MVVIPHGFFFINFLWLLSFIGFLFIQSGLAIAGFVITFIGLIALFVLASMFAAAFAL